MPMPMPMPMPMRLALAAVALAAVALVVTVRPVWAEDAGSRYATVYRVTGFRLRATVVCPGNKRTMTERAVAAISSSEFQTFSKAYPQTIEKWMGEGAGYFNEKVMQNGIDGACRGAR